MASEVRTIARDLLRIDFDELRERRLAELDEMQQEQIALLTRLLDEQGGGTPPVE